MPPAYSEIEREGVDTLTLKEFIDKVDPERWLWREHAAAFSVGCKKAAEFNDEQEEEIFNALKVNLVDFETTWHQTRETYNKFFRARVIRCKHDGCPFKIQHAILAKINQQEDEDSHDIDSIDRYLCHYSWTNEHKRRADIQYHYHDIGKMIPGLDQNHSDIRGNLRPDHLYKTLEALNQGLFRRL